MNQVDSRYTTIFHLSIYSSEIIDVFSDLTKNVTLAFWVFETLVDYKFAWGLAVCTRFEDLDLVLMSQISGNQKLQIVFRFLSTVI